MKGKLRREILSQGAKKIIEHQSPVQPSTSLFSEKNSRKNFGLSREICRKFLEVNFP